MPASKPTRQEMAHVEIMIGRILQLGVVVSAVIMLIGLLLFFAHGNSGYPENVLPLTLKAIGTGVLQGKAYAWMMSGIYCLILTPVLRVVVSIYAFAREQDWLYVTITVIVLLILMVAFAIGITG